MKRVAGAWLIVAVMWFTLTIFVLMEKGHTFLSAACNSVLAALAGLLAVFLIGVVVWCLE